MTFNFGAKKSLDSSSPTSPILTDEEDLTEGLSEEDCRKALNTLGRACALFMLGSTAQALTSQSKEELIEGTLVRSFNRRAIIHLDNLFGDDSQANPKIRKVLPLSRV